jgi:hypothetical protein
MKHRGFIAIIFLVGCATGGVASQLVVPPARAGTAPTRWEHFCRRASAASLTGVDSFTEKLDDAGARGWELVSVTPAHQDGQTVDEFTFC